MGNTRFAHVAEYVACAGAGAGTQRGANGVADQKARSEVRPPIQ
jgi:hypothetical protein